MFSIGCSKFFPLYSSIRIFLFNYLFFAELDQNQRQVTSPSSNGCYLGTPGWADALASPV